MGKEEIISTVLNCNAYLKTITTSKFVFGGSYGLFLNGIYLNRDFHDIDVKFLDLSVEERKKLKIDFKPSVDKLANIPIDLSYNEVIINDTPLLVFTTKSILDCKKYQLDFINNDMTTKTEKRLGHREKILADLKFIRDTYGID